MSEQVYALDGQVRMHIFTSFVAGAVIAVPLRFPMSKRSFGTVTDGSWAREIVSPLKMLTEVWN